MNRKSFIKRLALGFGAVVAAPSILAETKNNPISGAIQIGRGNVGLKLANKHEPIKIKLKNTSGNVIENIELFNPDNNLVGRCNYGLNHAIEVSCLNENLNYAEILFSLKATPSVNTLDTPLQIALIYVNNLRAVHTPIGVNNRFYVRKIDKGTQVRNLRGLYSPYQIDDNECLIHLRHDPVPFDSKTSFIVPNLKPYSEIELHFYDTKTIDNVLNHNLYEFEKLFLKF